MPSDMSLDVSALAEFAADGWDWTLGTSPDFGFVCRIYRRRSAKLRVLGDIRKMLVKSGTGSTPADAIENLLERINHRRACGVTRQ